MPRPPGGLAGLGYHRSKRYARPFLCANYPARLKALGIPSLEGLLVPLHQGSIIQILTAIPHVSEHHESINRVNDFSATRKVYFPGAAEAEGRC